MNLREEGINPSEVVAKGAVLAVSCVITYAVSTNLLSAIHSISRDTTCLEGCGPWSQQYSFIEMARRRVCNPLFHAWPLH
jgi:hypothetical protein